MLDWIASILNCVSSCIRYSLQSNKMATAIRQQLSAGLGYINPYSHDVISLPQEHESTERSWNAFMSEPEVRGKGDSTADAPMEPANAERDAPAASVIKLDAVPEPVTPPESTTDEPCAVEKEDSALPSLTDSKPALQSLLEEMESQIKGRWTSDKEETIRGPYDYISSAPGKEFRTQLINALNLWHRIPADSMGTIANVVRMLHNASLLIDDIQDNSALRRGRPVAHSIYGVAQTINSANFIYFLALEELKKLRNPNQAVDIFTQEMLALHRGQGMDLFWRESLTCPTEADYLEMVSNKTGGLFRIAVRLMQSESDMGVDCMPLIDLMGLIFQIADDYKNLADPNYTQSKGYCEDLTEGKFSFPVIHSIHSRPGNQVLVNILSQRPTELEIKRYAVEYMQSTGSLEYTRQFVEALAVKAKALAVELDSQCGIEGNFTLSLVEKMARI